MNTLLIKYLILVVVCTFTGWKLAENHYTAEIATIQKKYTEEKASAAKVASDKLRSAQSLADVLSQSLNDANQNTQQLTLEKKSEIHTYSSGAACFSADLTKLLNATTIADIDLLRNNPSAPATEDAATQADSEQPLTDEDIASWIVYAKGEYETCRGRLNTLIDFNNGLNTIQNKGANDGY